MKIFLNKLGAVATCMAAITMARSAAAQPSMGQMVNKVEVGFVAEKLLTRSLDLVGSIEPWQAIEISSKVRGLLTSVKVEEGQAVEKGDLLFEQDARADEIALMRAEAELDKAKAEFAKRNSGFLPQEIDEADRAVKVAEARYNAAREEWERLRPLADQEIISKTEATRARSESEVASSEVSRAKARLGLIKEGFRSEEVQIAAADIRVRQAEVDEIRRSLDDHSIKAPASGAIIVRHKEAGEWNAEGESVVSMVVLNPVKIRVEVPQVNITEVRRGQTAHVTVDGLAGEDFEAEVTGIIPQAMEGTRNFPVLLKVDNSKGLLAAGMFSRVKIGVGETRSVMTVPREAVRNLGLRQVVYRVDDLPSDFSFAPPEPPPGMAKKKGGGGRRPGGPGGGMKMTPPDSIASEIHVEILEELRHDLVIAPRAAGELKPGDEIVVYGNSRLKSSSLLLRLNPVAPGAG